MKLETYLRDTRKLPIHFADEMGVNRSTVTRWLNGERVPSLAMVQKISRATKGWVGAEDFNPVRREAAE